MAKTVNEIMVDVQKLNAAALRELHKRVVTAYNIKRRSESAVAIDTLKAGDRVEFTSSKYGLVRGTVTKLGQTNVFLKADTGENWRVSATMVRKIVGKGKAVARG